MSRDEKIMLGTMGAAVCLWVAGDALGISAVTTAMMGLCVLLGSGVLAWRECLTYPAAWDTLFWFAGACMLACMCVRMCVCLCDAGTVPAAACIGVVAPMAGSQQC